MNPHRKPATKPADYVGFWMKQNFRSLQQHLDRITTKLLKQMVELENLREAVRLAEVSNPPANSELHDTSSGEKRSESASISHE